ncbi:distal tail protein Dit, partial [Paludifilum halophilum]
MGFSFAGVHNDQYRLKVLKTTRRILPPMNNHLISIPGSDGAYDYGFDYGELLIEVDILLFEESRAELRSRVRDLADWLGQKETKELVFDDEPNMTYFARLSDSTELEELIYAGKGTITFLCPKPFAYGPEKDQLIAGIVKQEDTHTEEGWAAGTLSGVAATPDGLKLAKEGEDYSNYVDAGWDGGTHENTEEKDNDFLVLAKSGQDFNYSYTTSKSIPSWEFISRFEPGSVGEDGDWYVRNQSGGTYTLDGEKIIFEGDTDEDSVYIRRDSSGLNGSPLTMDFRARITKGSGARPFVSVNDAETGGIDVELPDTGGTISWFRLVYRGGTDFTLYQDGAEITPESVFDYGATSMGYINIGLDNGPCTFEVWKLGHANANHGAPPPDHTYTDELVGDLASLSGVGVLASSSYSRRIVATEAYDYSTSAYSGLSTDGGDTWNETELSSESGSIPGFSKGDDVTGYDWRFRWTMTSRDSIDSVYLDSFDADFVSGRHPSGYRDSPVINLSQVGRAATSSFSWTVKTFPPGSTITPYVRFSYDNQESWTDWQEVTENGGEMPGLDTDADLSDTYFQYRFQLTTDDVEFTPEVDRADYEVTTAYVPEGERISDPITFGDFGSVGGSYISWDTTPDGSEDVEVYAQVVNEGEDPDPNAWVQATNTGELPGAEVGTDMTGKAVYTRQVLKTSDPETTPTLHRQLWTVEPDSDDAV